MKTKKLIASIKLGYFFPLLYLAILSSPEAFAGQQSKCTCNGASSFSCVDDGTGAPGLNVACPSCKSQTYANMGLAGPVSVNGVYIISCAANNSAPASLTQTSPNSPPAGQTTATAGGGGNGTSISASSTTNDDQNNPQTNGFNKVPTMSPAALAATQQEFGTINPTQQSSSGAGQNPSAQQAAAAQAVNPVGTLSQPTTANSTTGNIVPYATLEQAFGSQQINPSNLNCPAGNSCWATTTVPDGNPHTYVFNGSDQTTTQVPGPPGQDGKPTSISQVTPATPEITANNDLVYINQQDEAHGFPVPSDQITAAANQQYALQHGAGTTAPNTQPPQGQALDPAVQAKKDSDAIQDKEDAASSRLVKANTFTPSIDDCALSANVGGTSCSGMRSTMEVTKITAAVASQIGSQAVQMIGQQSQQTAMMNGGSMASLYQGSAKLQAQAAAANVGMGTVQVGMGVLINSQADTHQKEYKNTFQALDYEGSKSQTADATAGSGDLTITGSSTTGVDPTLIKKVYNNGLTGKVSDNTSSSNNNRNNRNGGGNRNSDKTGELSQAMGEDDKATVVNDGGDNSGPKTLKAREAAAIGSAYNYADAASAEQKTASVDGHAAALTNMVQGGGAMISGTFQYLQAKQMENLYAQMANAPTVSAPGADPFAAPGAIRAASTVSGTGTDPNAAAATAATAPAPASSGGPLGAPLGDIPSGPAFGTPADPGAAVAATPGTQGGAAVGAAGGIGTSAVPGSATEEKQAQYDAGRNTAGYEGVGGFTPGGAGGKGNSNDPSIDPKTLMQAMLDQMGQKKEDDQAPGILNYRTVASDNNAPLPAEENFFKRFHDDYQEFQRKGQVGL